jgi:hypothetical protein
MVKKTITKDKLKKELNVLQYVKISSGRHMSIAISP